MTTTATAVTSTSTSETMRKILSSLSAIELRLGGGRQAIPHTERLSLQTQLDSLRRQSWTLSRDTSIMPRILDAELKLQSCPSTGSGLATTTTAVVVDGSDGMSSMFAPRVVLGQLMTYLTRIVVTTEQTQGMVSRMDDRLEEVSQKFDSVATVVDDLNRRIRTEGAASMRRMYAFTFGAIVGSAVILWVLLKL